MLLAIDVGNTHTVYGVHDGTEWRNVWRRMTNPDDTEDQIAGWLSSLFRLSELKFHVEHAICASVVPSLNLTLSLLCERWLKTELVFLRTGESVGLKVIYEPKTSVGADRLANALGALQKYEPPLIVVDFGTGTNFDVVDRDGSYIGGAIMPGVLVGSEALFRRAAKLPHVNGIDLVAPQRAIGKSTVESLQSGIVLGYASAIDGLVTRMASELECDCRVVSTGGLGSMFLGVCQTIEAFEPYLTLDGLRVAHSRLASSV